jgi:hypothetical protein
MSPMRSAAARRRSSVSLRRGPALVLAGVIATAPLWFAAAAHAADQVVTFAGVPDITESTVSCPSTPDRSTLTVNPGETVDFVNHLGETATLTSSTSHQDLDNGEMVPVTFTAATASISIEMLPHCNLDVGVHQAVTVTVRAVAVDPSASASVSASAPPRTPSPSSSAGNGLSASSGPKHPGPAKHTPKHRPTAAPSRSPTISGAGNGGDADPPGPTRPIETTAPFRFGDPVSAIPAPRGASGLLTLIATVSVGGVTAAAIRAIVAHRATRSLTL